MRIYAFQRTLHLLIVLLAAGLPVTNARAAMALGSLLRGSDSPLCSRAALSMPPAADRASVPELVPGEFSAKRGWLGVTLRDSPGFPMPGDGPRVINVLPATPAAAGGFKAGDRIIEVGSARALGVRALVRLIAFERVGGAAVFALRRSGATKLLGVLIGDRGLAERSVRQDFETMGLALRASGLGTSLEPMARIRNVQTGSPAARFGLRRGMRITRVNGRKVATARDVLRVIFNLTDRYVTRREVVFEVEWMGAFLVLRLEAGGP